MRKRGNVAGFSLTEMMVVVGIVGITAAIAVPNYLRYNTRSRQSEVKTALSSIFAAERTYALEFGSYTSCLAQIGFQPIPVTERYYAVGYTGNANLWCGRNGTTSCDTYRSGSPACVDTDMGFSAGKRGGESAAVAASTDLNNNTVGRDMFLARAAGNVGGTGNSTFDRWSINQNKVMLNYAPAM